VGCPLGPVLGMPEGDTVGVVVGAEGRETANHSKWGATYKIQARRITAIPLPRETIASKAHPPSHHHYTVPDTLILALDG
jgi:hypothetical protein